MIFGLLTGPLFFNTQQVPQGVKKSSSGGEKVHRNTSRGRDSMGRLWNYAIVIMQDSEILIKA
jgi:hypothetical protein